MGCVVCRPLRPICAPKGGGSARGNAPGPLLPEGPDVIGYIDQDLIMIAEMMPRRSSPAEGRAARSGPIGRARRILGTSLTYVDHPSFRDPTARDAILAPPT